MSEIVVFGATGQVGRALKNLLGDSAVFLRRQDADFSVPDSLPSILDRLRPRAVINASAYTQVDLAEKEESLAEIINGKAPGILAHWCVKREVPIVHFSTDYVFSGDGERPWEETDPVAPLNAYGRTKLLGETLIQEAGGHWLIFRTSWVYDAHGRNFLNAMLRLGGDKEVIRVVSDQVGAPTYAPHLAAATLDALLQARNSSSFPSGIYHLCSAGQTHWQHFALAIFRNARERGLSLQVKRVEPISSEEYPTPAKRPKNSRLNTERIARTLGIRMPHWSVGLSQCMEHRR